MDKKTMDLLEWARNNNVMRLKCGDVEVEFAPAPINAEHSEAEMEAFIEDFKRQEQSKDQAQEKKEQDEMLYYSA